MNRKQGLKFLNQCADMQGKHWSGGYQYPANECPTCEGTNIVNHYVPCSRYGRNTAECAPVAWRLAYVVARECGDLPVSRDSLDWAMSLVVNDSDSVAEMIRAHGHYMYR
jgi:hypothetical protein